MVIVKDASTLNTFSKEYKALVETAVTEKNKISSNQDVPLYIQDQIKETVAKNVRIADIVELLKIPNVTTANLEQVPMLAMQEVIDEINSNTLNEIAKLEIK